MNILLADIYLCLFVPKKVPTLVKMAFLIKMYGTNTLFWSLKNHDFSLECCSMSLKIYGAEVFHHVSCGILKITLMILLIYIWMLMPRRRFWDFQMVIILCCYITLAMPLEKSSVCFRACILLICKETHLKRSFEDIWKCNISGIKCNLSSNIDSDR